jgi:hypothetical protein
MSTSMHQRKAGGQARGTGAPAQVEVKNATTQVKSTPHTRYQPVPFHLCHGIELQRLLAACKHSYCAAQRRTCCLCASGAWCVCHGVHHACDVHRLASKVALLEVTT